MTDKSIKIDYSNDLIFGKDKREGLVSVEVVNDEIELFYLDKTYETLPMTYWVLSNKRHDKHFTRLDGNNHYKFIKTFDNKKEYNNFVYSNKNKYDLYSVGDPVESAMIYNGFTLFKGLKVEDLGVLSFDIEADGIARTPDSMAFLITNTFKKGDKVEKIHFRLDDYDNPGQMIEDWCSYVREEIDPDVINGHNIFGYDLDYLRHVADKYNKTLRLGRNGDNAFFSKRDSKYRVDGSQEWFYKNCSIYGRHVIDGMFLSVKYDIGRNYPSWGLKPIAEYEGLIKEDRQFYDASMIGKNWHDPIEREKIVKYGIDDSDDSNALYYLQIPSFFYLTQSIPKSFQRIVNSASGSWLNSIMVRSYLQQRKSIPKSSEGDYVGGGMSYGIPGVYSNVTKWDADSYYPNTILTFDIYDKQKDPDANFLEMVKYFTDKRFEQKDQYKKTGDKHYDDLQASSKIFINSAYGLLGTPGLNFNSYENAALITACCRKGLQKCVVWATGKDIDYWWGIDDKLYKEVEMSEKDVIDKYGSSYEKTAKGTFLVPRHRSGENWKVCYKHSKTATQDFEDYSFIDSKSKLSFQDMPRHDWTLVNIDTDSLSFAKEDGTEFTDEECAMIYKEVNDIMYSAWSDDGMFDRVLVVKAKNYVLQPKGSDKLKIKGSSFLSSNKEIALQEMLKVMAKDLISGENNYKNIYRSYIKEVMDIKDIKRWAIKKSISEKTIEGNDTSKRKVLEAVKHLEYQVGNKYYLFQDIDGERQVYAKGEPKYSRMTRREYEALGLSKKPPLSSCKHKPNLFCMDCNPHLYKPTMKPNDVYKVVDNFTGSYDKYHYMKRLYDTITILEPVLDMEGIINYNLVRNRDLLDELD